MIASTPIDINSNKSDRSFGKTIESSEKPTKLFSSVLGSEEKIKNLGLKNQSETDCFIDSLENSLMGPIPVLQAPETPQFISPVIDNLSKTIAQAGIRQMQQASAKEAKTTESKTLLQEDTKPIAPKMEVLSSKKLTSSAPIITKASTEISQNMGNLPESQYFTLEYHAPQTKVSHVQPIQPTIDPTLMPELVAKMPQSVQLQIHDPDGLMKISVGRAHSDIAVHIETNSSIFPTIQGVQQTLENALNEHGFNLTSFTASSDDKNEDSEQQPDSEREYYQKEESIKNTSTSDKNSLLDLTV